MPKVYAFAKEHVHATDYSAIQHPSLPNYLAIVAGSTLGVNDDGPPSQHQLTQDNVFRQALTAGKTAKVYAESMPQPCALTDSGHYAVKHNPWAYFASPQDRAACQQYDVPATELPTDTAAGNLPNVGFVIPDLIDDAHDGTLTQADDWISTQIDTLTNGPDWNTGHLAIVVTADEDDKHSDNKVLTIIATKDQTPGVVTTALDHYSLTAFLEDVLHVPHLAEARNAPSLTDQSGVR
jgi:acid phosphatase